MNYYDYINEGIITDHILKKDVKTLIKNHPTRVISQKELVPIHNKHFRRTDSDYIRYYLNKGKLARKINKFGHKYLKTDKGFISTNTRAGRPLAITNPGCRKNYNSDNMTIEKAIAALKLIHGKDNANYSKKLMKLSNKAVNEFNREIKINEFKNKIKNKLKKKKEEEYDDDDFMNPKYNVDS